MKKSGFIMLIMFFAFLLFPFQVLAVDFSINETKIDVYLQENGHVFVTESHTYEFEGDFNGITRTIIPKENTAITEFTASEGNTSLKIEKEDELYKVYRSGSDETITVELSYSIQNGVEVYEDMGQFYWPFFDSSNESDYENLSITVHPPIPSNDVIAYGFDAAYETETIAGDGSVTFQLGYVSSGSNGDIRAAYNSGLFPEAAVLNGTIRDEILRDEQKMAEKRENFLSRQETLKNTAPYVIGAFVFFLFFLLFYGWRYRKHALLEAERFYQSNSIVPKETMSMPAIVYYFRNHMAEYGELLTTGMMDLVRKGIVAVQDDDTYSLVKSKTDHAHEALLTELLFKKIGKNNSFSFEQLDKHMKSTLNQKHFPNELYKYRKAIIEEINENQLYEKHLKLRWFTGLVSVLLIPLMIIYGIHDLFMWLFFSIILMIALLLFAFLFQPKTVKGHAIKQQWNEFNREFSEADIDKWSQLSHDEKERITIFSAGSKDKKLKAKNKSFIEHEASGDYTAYLPLFFLLTLSDTANRRFDSATDVSAASLDSGSSSSGAGVGGGGGGSGAF